MHRSGSNLHWERPQCVLGSRLLEHRLISALGQKRTYRSANVMSALPPKADIRQRRIGKLWTAGNQLRFIYLPT
jgi:hypothetical protein